MGDLWLEPAISSREVLGCRPGRVGHQRDRGDVRPGEAGTLLPPVFCESGEGCVIDTGRIFWAERSEVCLERLKKNSRL